MNIVPLSVIIVNRDTCQLLAACLRSVIASLGENDYEILVVDNASHDGSPAMVKELFPAVRLIQNAINRGFAAANNQALALSHGRYLLLLNPDTLVRNQAISTLTAFLDAHPKVGMVTAKLLNPDGSLQHSAFRFPTLWMSFLDFFPVHYRVLNSRLNGRYPFHYYDQPFPIDHPLGACMMVRREVVETVGPLSEEFFIYCEEIDWCRRIKQAGWLIYCQPKAKIIHYGGQSTAQAQDSMFVELHKSRFRLFRKYHSPAFRAAAKAIVGLGLGKEILKGWSAYRYGELPRSQWQQRLRACGQIWRIITAHG